LKAYNNIQQASTVVYQAYNENQPDQQLPPPREVVRTPIPPEVMQAYSVTDATSQMILGTFDAALVSTITSLAGWRFKKVLLSQIRLLCRMSMGTCKLVAYRHYDADLLPLYIVTARTIPVVGLDGKRTYEKVNQQNGQGAQLDYDQSALNIYIELA